MLNNFRRKIGSHFASKNLFIIINYPAPQEIGRFALSLVEIERNNLYFFHWAPFGKELLTK